MKKHRLLVNLYCGLIPDRVERRKIRRVLLNQDKTEFLTQQNAELLGQVCSLEQQNNDLQEQLRILQKKKVLIVSKNFSGGGLETRINNIVNQLHDKYTFSLITQTAPENMRIKPSQYFEHIYSWDEYRDALYKVDILDVHPFNVDNLINEWNIPSQMKKTYTLHGEASIIENLHFLHNYNRIFTVSELLRPYINENYPNLKDRLVLSKNRDVIKNYNAPKSDGKNILVSITNTNDKDIIQNIIDVIPSQYNVNLIGYFQPGTFVRKNGELIYHGFVNIDELFEQNHFDMAFTRGGFATMDVVARNIPCLCISSNDNGMYFDVLSRDNFESMSDCNFVTRKPLNNKDILNAIKSIEEFPQKYQCRDLLEIHNKAELIEDLYEGL